LLPRSEALRNLESVGPAFATHAWTHGHMCMHVHMCAHTRRSVASNPLRRRCNSALQSARLAPLRSRPSVRFAVPCRADKAFSRFAIAACALIWARCMSTSASASHLHVLPLWLAAPSARGAYVPRPTERRCGYIRYRYDAAVNPSMNPEPETRLCCRVDVFPRTRSRAADLMNAVPLSAARSCGVRWRSLSRMA
jgi:hypothetical protein